MKRYYKEVDAETLSAYFKAWRAVYDDRKVSRSDLVVLFLIKDAEFPTYFKTQVNMAKQTGYSRWTVNQAVKKLKEQGYIRTAYRSDSRGSLVVMKLSEALSDPRIVSNDEVAEAFDELEKTGEQVILADGGVLDKSNTRVQKVPMGVEKTNKRVKIN